MIRAPGRDIVVIGASAGGIEPISQILEVLPPSFPAPVFVAIHRPNAPSRHDLLRHMLSRLPLMAVTPADGQAFEPGYLYVAPTDQHLLLENRTMRLQRSPTENRFRPSIDALFRSAASVYGRRVIGILL